MPELATQLGLWFISDEIYHGLTYEARATTALAASPDAIIVNSFSKYFCMTGWRSAGSSLPERLVRPVERLAQNLFISPPYVSQVAAEAAFEARPTTSTPCAPAMRAAARSCSTPCRASAFRDPRRSTAPSTSTRDVARLTNDSVDFCRRALDEAEWRSTPGVDFDRARGARHVRLSFAGSPESVREGVDRLATWLKRGI